MSQISSFAVDLRDRAGKGAARATRREGRVPGVIYGDKQPPLLISLDPRDLNREMHRAGFFARLFDLKLGEDTHRVLARDVQMHRVTDRPIHVDFLRVGAGAEVTVEVPVRFINELAAPGLKKGGTLNVVRHAVELICKATDIPDELVCDLAGFEMGQSIHISHIKLPEGARPTITDRDFTIASVLAPAGIGKADQ